jgi:hypothetical protein
MPLNANNWWQTRSRSFLIEVIRAFNQATMAGAPDEARHALVAALRQVRSEYEAFRHEQGLNGGTQAPQDEQIRRELQALPAEDRQMIADAIVLLGESAFEEKIERFGEDVAKLEEQTIDAGADRIKQAGAEADFLKRFIEMVFDYPCRRLIVYGSLAPGEMHEDYLKRLNGQWRQAEVHGHIDCDVDFPRFHWDPEADPQPVQIFESAELPASYGELDAFEGPEYRRIFVPALVDGICIIASVYAANGASQ